MESTDTFDPMEIPELWVDADKISHGLLSIKGRFFFVAKSPLPAGINNLLAPRDKWGVKELDETVRDLMKEAGISGKIHLFDVDPELTLISKKECSQFAIDYNLLRFTEHNSFGNVWINYQNEFNSTPVGDVIIIADRLGYEWSGIVLIYYLCISYPEQHEILDVLEKYSKFKPPGFFRQDLLAKLCGHLSIDNPSYNIPFPTFFNSTTKLVPSCRSDPFILYNSIPESEVPPEVKEYFQKNIQESPGYDNTVSGPIPKIRGFGGAYEIEHMIDDVGLDNYLCGPYLRGILCFVIGIKCDCIYLVAGNLYFRYKAEIKMDEFPFIVSARAAKIGNELRIYIDDVICIGERSPSEICQVDLEERLSIIWFQILPGIVISKEESPDLRLVYRAMCRVEQHEIQSMPEDWQKNLNIMVDGIAIHKKTDPPGKFSLVGTRPTLIGKFHLIGTCWAMIFAFADDGVHLDPILAYQIRRKDENGLNDQFVRLDIAVAVATEKQTRPRALQLGREYPDPRRIWDAYQNTHSMKIHYREVFYILEMIAKNTDNTRANIQKHKTQAPLHFEID